MANVDIRQGYKNAAWFTSNATRVLKEGQVVHLEQTGTYKVGDGTTQLSALAFLGGSGGGGQVDTVQGTTNRISVDATDPENPILDISSAYDTAITNAIAASKNSQKIITGTCTPQTTTGVTALTIISPITSKIPAGTVTGNCIITIFALFSRNTVSSTTTLRIYISAAYDLLSGRTYMLTGTLNAAQRTGVLRLDLVIAPDGTTTYWNGVASTNSDSLSSNQINPAATHNWAVDQYVNIASQPSSAAESITLYGLSTTINYLE